MKFQGGEVLYFVEHISRERLEPNDFVSSGVGHEGPDNREKPLLEAMWRKFERGSLESGAR